MIVIALRTALLLATGAFLWTFFEYMLHRFAMHELKGKGMASREHLNHHADKDSILEKWFLSWSGVLLVGFGIWGYLLGSYTVSFGWIFGYALYDGLHWRAHRRAPRGRYDRWLRRHHFFHHFSQPMKNHGVTTPLWDKVFGTYVEPGVIKVPRRMAMVWLVDADGELRPEYAGDYEVVGRRQPTSDQRVEDKRDAYANMAPSV